MTPNERRAARARRQDLKRAVDVQKRHPGFPAAQVQILERTKELEGGLTEDQTRWCSPARLETVLRLLDIRAAAYLQLVIDMESQEAFMTVLNELGRQAWLELTGHPIEVLHPLPGDKQLHAINQRIGHWLGEGYKRLLPSAAGLRSGVDAAFAPVASGDQATQDGHVVASTSDADREQFAPHLRGPQPDTTQVDIAVITIREDEYEAVLSRLERWEFVKRTQRTYVIGKVSNSDGGSYGVAILRSIEQGPNAANDAARAIIEDLRPQWLAVVGIGGAIPDTEFTLGDVVVASRLHDFTVGALIEDSVAQFANQGGPMKKEVQDLIALLPALKRDLGEWASDARIGRPCPPVDMGPDKFYGLPEWKQKVEQDLKARFGPRANRHSPIAVARSIASSGSLIKDTRTVEQWRQTARDRVAVEMELSGVYAAARRMDREYPILAVRGISDVVGFKRDAAWTEYACNTAASFFFALLRAMPNRTLKQVGAAQTDVESMTAENSRRTLLSR